MKKKRVAIYVRVSTEDQTHEHQVPPLKGWAKNAGHEIVATFDDKMSGVKAGRPGFRRMMKAAVNREFDMVAVWSIDRLGRSTSQVTSAIDQLRELDIDIFVSKQGIDSTTMAGRAMLAMCAIFAEMERELNRERTKAGLRTAVRRGQKLGRPRVKAYNPKDRTDVRIREMLRNGATYAKIQAQLSVGASKIKRIRDTLTLDKD